MKITKKQEEEIDFFAKQADPPFIPTQEEKEDYIRSTVFGQSKDTLHETNRLILSKRMFDITIPMWREDMVNGLLLFEELEEDFGDHPFGRKLINSVLRSLDFKKYRPGQGFVPTAVSNGYKAKLMKN